MRTKALFPTAYLPTISYFAMLTKYEEVLIEQQETFPKQTIRNRANISTSNGILPLIVPAVRPQGNHTRTAEIETSYAENWNIQHWRAIESAYNSSPYFLYYKDEIEHIITSKHNTLLELNQALTSILCKKLKIEVTFEFTKEFEKPGTRVEDYRSAFPIKSPCPIFRFKGYEQVFLTKHPFEPDLSVIDLLFNMGPEAKDYLISLPIL